MFLFNSFFTYYIKNQLQNSNKKSVMLLKTPTKSHISNNFVQKNQQLKSRIFPTTASTVLHFSEGHIIYLLMYFFISIYSVKRVDVSQVLYVIFDVEENKTLRLFAIWFYCLKKANSTKPKKKILTFLCSKLAQLYALFTILAT